MELQKIFYPKEGIKWGEKKQQQRWHKEKQKQKGNRFLT